MIWTIAKKEFYSNILTSRFTIGFILCTLLIPLSTHVSVKRYEEKRRIYDTEFQQYDKELKQIRVYSQIRPTILKPPEPLAIFAAGVEENLGNRVKIQLGQVSLMAEGSAQVRENPLLASFLSIDFTFIITIIFSLLAFLFTYDALSSEKEKGVLKLILANKVPRDQLLMGKYLGSLLTLLPIVVISFLMGILVIIFSKSVAFHGEEWQRVLIFGLLSLFFVSVFILLGMLL